jgi:hypothetical protein
VSTRLRQGRPSPGSSRHAIGERETERGEVPQPCLFCRWNLRPSLTPDGAQWVQDARNLQCATRDKRILDDRLNRVGKKRRRAR